MAENMHWTSRAYRCRLLATLEVAQDICASDAADFGRLSTIPIPALAELPTGHVVAVTRATEVVQEQEQRDDNRSVAEVERISTIRWSEYLRRLPYPFASAFPPQWRGRVKNCEILRRMECPEIFGDATGELTAESIAEEKMVPISFDLIIDDGFHSARANIASFTFLWPYLRAGGQRIMERSTPPSKGVSSLSSSYSGVYIIEDMNPYATDFGFFLETTLRQTARAFPRGAHFDNFRDMWFHPRRAPFYTFGTSKRSTGAGLVVRKTSFAEQMLPLKLAEVAREVEAPAAENLFADTEKKGTPGAMALGAVAEHFCFSGRVEYGRDLILNPIRRMQEEAASLSKDYLEQSSYGQSLTGVLLRDEWLIRRMGMGLIDAEEARRSLFIEIERKNIAEDVLFAMRYHVDHVIGNEGRAHFVNHLKRESKPDFTEEFLKSERQRRDRTLVTSASKDTGEDEVTETRSLHETSLDEHAASLRLRSRFLNASDLLLSVRREANTLAVNRTYENCCLNPGSDSFPDCFRSVGNALRYGETRDTFQERWSRGGKNWAEIFAFTSLCCVPETVRRQTKTSYFGHEETQNDQERLGNQTANIFNFYANTDNDEL
ncbi:unnamed protein product [Amoebophrya sp. A25]|nr:unnamed protein product [Amoebophrya sp. A25]|eukprot:GSA25T00005642001.1